MNMPHKQILRVLGEKLWAEGNPRNLNLRSPIGCIDLP
jgi:hypothetical protein